MFDTLNAIFYKRDKHEYDKKKVNGFMLSMWLSHDQRLLDIANDINRYQFSLPDKLIYQYYYHAIPKGKRFIKWTKKEKVDKKREDIIVKLSKKYNCSILEMKKSLIFYKE